MLPVTIIVLVAVASVAGNAALAIAYVKNKRKLDDSHAQISEAQYNEANARRIAKTEVDQENKKILADMEKQFRDRVAAFEVNFSVDSAHMISQAIAGDHVARLETELTKSVESSFGKIVKEFVGTLGEEAEFITQELQMELAENVWTAFQNYKEVHKDNPFIFPDGIRVAYTKGNRTIMVIEQPPQVRSVTFASSLVGSSEVARQAISKTDIGYRFNLAFPFVYFVIVFDQGRYTYHSVYFRNKPLTTAREYIYLAPLPNVFRDRGTGTAVCMGNDFYNSVGEDNSLVKQANSVIGEFWQRPFSGDLGTGLSTKTDKRIKNYAVWQKNSQKDPLFILDITWSQGKTLKGIIESLMESRDHKNQLDSIDRHIREMLDQGVNKVLAEVKRQVKEFKQTKLDAQLVDTYLKEEIEQLITNHTKQVFEQCKKL